MQKVFKLTQDGKNKEIGQAVQEALDAGCDPTAILNDAMIGAMAVKAVESAREKLLVSYSCFDVFTDPSGEKLPADRKSIAYTFLYRDPAKTPHGRGSGRRAPARAESPDG